MEIGVDCVEIHRFEEITNNKKLLYKIFTEKEIQYCKSKTPSPQHFAVRFAGKEALLKALSPYNIQIPLNQIEILNNKGGSPFIKIFNDQYKYLEMKISLSHSKETAIAFVIVSDKKQTGQEVKNTERVKFKDFH